MCFKRPVVIMMISLTSSNSIRKSLSAVVWWQEFHNLKQALETQTWGKTDNGSELKGNLFLYKLVREEQKHGIQVKWQSFLAVSSLG